MGYFRGGLLIDLMKHNHIEAAKRNLEDLKYLVDRFARELKDVNFSLNINIEIGGLLSFSDWFFDGFFVDMFVKTALMMRGGISKNISGLWKGWLRSFPKSRKSVRRRLQRLKMKKEFTK